jgi:hypothetical protein
LWRWKNKIIDDLDYIETVSRASKLVGAGETIATGSANKFAIYGFGSVGANAFAIGENTSTLANTDTKVYVSFYIAFTEASATANSYARMDLAVLVVMLLLWAKIPRLWLTLTQRSMLVLILFLLKPQLQLTLTLALKTVILYP